MTKPRARQQPRASIAKEDIGNAERAKPDAAKPDAEGKSGEAKSEPAKMEAPKDNASGEKSATRHDPVPPVTPAPPVAASSMPASTPAPAVASGGPSEPTRRPRASSAGGGRTAGRDGFRAAASTPVVRARRHHRFPSSGRQVKRLASAVAITKIKTRHKNKSPADEAGLFRDGARAAYSSGAGVGCGARSPGRASGSKNSPAAAIASAAASRSS